MQEHVVNNTAGPALVILTFFYHNNAIRSVLCDLSHLCYYCYQSKLCHYLLDRDRAFTKRDTGVITSVYWIIKAEREEHKQKYAECKQKYSRSLTAETFVGSGIITYSSTRDCWQKICPICKNSHFFLQPHFAYSLPSSFHHYQLPLTVCGKTKTPLWEIAINQTNKQEWRPPILPPTSALLVTPSKLLFFLFFSAFWWPPTHAGNNNSLVCKLSFSERANGDWIMSADMLINLGFSQR